jgi:hypothetical protein
MTHFAYALPILPGQSEAAASFESDLDAAGFRDRYEELNRQGKVRVHREWLQSTPTGDVLVVLFETDDPMALARSFVDGDAYDDWWRARVKRIHGFDPATVAGMPRLVVSWDSDEKR